MMNPAYAFVIYSSSYNCTKYLQSQLEQNQRDFDLRMRNEWDSIDYYQ